MENKELSIVESQFNLVPKNLTEAMEFAKLLAASEVVPKDYRGKPADILVAVQMGLEVGLKPLQALQGIACINGRPTIWGDAALGLVRKSGLLEEYDEDDANKALKQGFGRCRIKRKGEAAIERVFSIDDAKRAALWERRGKEGQPTPWVTYPGRMLQMRARSWAIRDAFADVLKGLHVREEVEDYETVATEGKTEIQMPKSRVEAGAADAILKGLKPAGGTSTAPASAAAPVDRSRLVRALIQSAEQKTGNGKTFYVVGYELSDGKKGQASTFSETAYGLATQLKGSLAMILTVEKKVGEKTFTNLMYIEADTSAPEGDAQEPPPEGGAQ